MNKIKFAVLAALFIVSAGSAMAQKTGYIRVDDVVRLMPETQKVQSTLERYQADSLQPRFNYTLSEFQRKDSIVNGKDSLKTPAAARAKMREEMQQDMYELQNWQSISQQLVQNRQEQLLEPIFAKAIEAVQQTAKENGYTYVYTKDALLVAPPADDLLPLVAKKLGLKIPGSTATAPAGAANTPKKQ
ncbi:MAG TPA: OmpH family outer membrane protein [Flavisolibacter sp.]|jgi:outer membrane protein|nr:OmpH family outer membrane protein [Flavisolibacter sp.]